MHSGNNVKRCLASVALTDWLRYFLIRLLFPLKIPLIRLYLSGNPGIVLSNLPYIAAVFAALVAQMLLLALLGCRLVGSPFAVNLFIHMMMLFPLVFVLPDLIGRYRCCNEVHLFFFIFLVVLSVIMFAGALRCAPRIQQLLSRCGLRREFCCDYIMWEAVGKPVHRVEYVAPRPRAAPSWRVFRASAVAFYVGLIPFPLAFTTATDPGELPTLFVVLASSIAVSIALRVAVSKRVGAPLCYTYASILLLLPYMIALAALHPARAHVGILTPRSSEPLGVVVPFLVLLALNGAAMAVDMYAAKRLGRLGLCLLQVPAPVISAGDEAES